MTKLFRKALAGILSFFLICSVSINNTYASVVPEYVRVGLEYKYKNVSSIPITNKIVNLGIGSMGGFTKETTITAETAFSMNISKGYHVDMKQLFSNYQDAFNASKLYGNYKAAPVLFDSGVWGVYMVGFDSTAEANTFLLSNGGEIIQPGSGILEIKDGNNTVAVFKDIKPVISPSGNDIAVTLNDRSYRGAIEFGIYKGSSMTAVNIVGFEEYLYSVIPSEMPSGYNIEALKAQACAARTYAITKIGLHSQDGYELCDGVSCQVYKGVDSETSTTTLAVNETKGKVIYYEGKAINAVFFSNSGGYTESSENVWIDKLGYLIPVTEISEYDTKVWTRTFTKNDINNILSSSGANIGSVKDIVIAEASDSGRVQKLNIVCTAGIKTLTKENIRTFFAPSGGSLDSRMFTINGSGSIYTPPETNVNDNIFFPSDINTDIKMDDSYIMGTYSNFDLHKIEGLLKLNKGETLNKTDSLKNYSNTADEFVISGRGSGHGVGMSQKGAEGMARMGRNYIDILKYYYTGVEVK